MVTLEQITLYAKQTGFIFQGSEIYGGLANTWDYGPLGSLLKKNIKEAWIQKFVRENPYNVLLDSSILLNSKVWEASGHIGGFSDPLTENKDNNQRYRADKLIIEHDPSINPDGWTPEKMHEYLVKNKVMGTTNWTPIRSFNMMFQTHQGVVLEQANQIFLRPETAQGIFINFKNIQRTTRKKLPFGVCQVGKAFRNEITPGNFVFRTREFEQMELEFFCKPGTEMEWFNYWKQFMKSWLLNLGIHEENVEFEDHKKEALSHYSNATTDILYKFPWGFDELWGIASRTNFDLNAHQKHSGEDLTYLDPETNERYIPYVVEPSVGVERLVLAFLTNSYKEEKLENDDTRQVLALHPALAPYKVAVLPLMKKVHAEKALQLELELAKHFDVTYDETQNIGKRYRRQDAIGTPFCVTVDQETMENDTVTIRHRDTMAQERLQIKDLKAYIEKYLEF
ncbi:Glycyl-tRNA synthetase [Alteracholeplasma palmae J233]|uniref:Glycine--tRNA ligase n=1 Tax=Alteracholeplasma palmae (strain ATCC 49389 / J233) TaxID=1318466 RepID=U4KPJ0_ALTPJ|nr:glycine--tRNA ligase [Alteracholeplasma palmae]CCV64165.1 Glycyl-tRNA synthetase [Alteracholeplasma palmae J233]